MIIDRSDECDGEAGIVELAVVINHSAFETGRFERGGEAEIASVRLPLRTTQAERARQGVIECQTDAVIRDLPPTIRRDEKCSVVHKMRGISE